MKRTARTRQKAPAPRASHGLPASSLSTYEQALRAASRGEHATAIALYRKVLAVAPNHAEALSFLGCSLREEGDFAAALAHLERALALQPRSVEARVHLAETQRRAQLRTQALETCEDALKREPRHNQALVVRGLARKELGDLEGAIEDLYAAATVGADTFALKTLVRLLIEAGRKPEAIPFIEKALKIDPKDYEAQRLAGDCYSGVGRIKEAYVAYQTAIDLNSSDAFTYANFAGMLIFTGQLDLAIAAGSIATRLAPNMHGAHFNLGMAYEMRENSPEALRSYVQALRCKPDLGSALLSICRLSRHDCAWQGLDEAERKAQALTYLSGEAASPFAILPMVSDPENLLACNRLWAAAMQQGVGTPLATYAPRPLERRRERIRLGYLSADYHQHATAALISELFELHDKAKFETFAYSIGPADHSGMRQRICASLDHFADLNALSHAEAAALIRADDIDILVDLKGYTAQARPQILAHRPAPIQVNYLGYPSTMGADFMDYILADHVIVPDSHAEFFTEKLVHLPNSYQPNDRKRKIGEIVPTRRACGLPDEGLVFCCFNANYKLNSQMFDIWMRLLAAVPGSVLWLLASNDRAPDNLRQEAAQRGIDPMRLVFAPKLPVEDHLARMTLGDLFLDTLPIGAHTTASEALWTGVPVVTCLGEAFPGRVGASLLRAVGLPELVTETLADYEALALRLAQNPDELTALKARLRAAARTAPLFDTPRYVQSYECALGHMMALREAGEAPAPFAVEETNGGAAVRRKETFEAPDGDRATAAVCRSWMADLRA
jgi:predicted O-linked N-acetylglucosamine transferase (SPINDLY family)